MFRLRDKMSARVRFVLFNPRQDPVKLSRGYLAVAECTNAADVDLQRRPAVRTIEIGASGDWLSFTVPDEGPVFAPVAQSVFRATDHAAARINRVVVTLRTDSHCN